jgi:hypothetical protein
MIDRGKPAHARALAWLIQFGLLPERPALWPAKLCELAAQYASLSSAYCGDSSQTTLEALVESIVPRDLGRSVLLFSQIFADLGLDTGYFDPAFIRFLRIFAVLSKADPAFRYFQGYDRFAYVAAAVSTAFCLFLGVSADNAEAITYFLTNFFLVKIAWRDPPDPRALINSQEIFGDVAGDLRRFYPATAAALASQKLQPNIYALKWVMVLFAEQHPVPDLLLVWDFVALNISALQPYVSGLIVAHLNQVQLGMDFTETVQRIQNTRQFDIARLVREADRVVGKAPSPVRQAEVPRGLPSAVFVIVPLVILAVAAYLVYRLL